MIDCDKITTDRLNLFPFSEEFISEKYVSWLNDPEIVKFSENRHRTHSLDSCREYFASFKGTPNCFWAICKKEGIHIGNINAYIDINNNIADVGIMIGDKSEQGKGYAFEAWKATCEYLFENKKIRKITGGCIAENLAMIHIMEKYYMIEDGRRKKHFLIDGKPFDVVHMAIFKPEL